MEDSRNDVHYIYCIIGAIICMFIAKYDNLHFLSSVLLGFVGVAIGFVAYAVSLFIGRFIGGYYEQIKTDHSTVYANRIRFIVWLAFIVIFSAIMYYL